MTPKAERQSDESLLSYFRAIRGTRLLTFEEELELSQRIQKGESAAKQRLIESNLRLVIRIARRYVTPDVSLMDLIQEGNLGLMKAASRYDHNRQVRFSTYASWWIKQSIVRSLSNKRRVIRLPHRKEESLRRINRVYNTLAQSLMRPPTVQEIAEDLGTTREEVSIILNISNAVVSLDTPTADEAGTLQDLVEDPAYDPARTLVQKSLREETMRVLEKLEDREKQVLLRRFSFFGGKKYTLKSIGEEMDISPETVRQIEMRALKKLRTHATELEAFIYNS
jgi:RNA polymerase primary sigma factor